MQVPRQLDVGSLSGHRSGAAGDRDVSSGYIHAGADYVPAVDRVAQRDVVQCAIGSDIAHGCEAGL